MNSLGACLSFPTTLRKMFYPPFVFVLAMLGRRHRVNQLEALPGAPQVNGMKRLLMLRKQIHSVTEERGGYKEAQERMESGSGR